MIIPENVNKNLEQKRWPWTPPPRPPHKKKKKKKKKRNKKEISRFGFLVKIHLLENSKLEL